MHVAAEERGAGAADVALFSFHFRGDAIRTFMVRPAALWAIAALALISLAWAAASDRLRRLHDDLMGATVARQAQMETAYEDRLAEARAGSTRSPADSCSTRIPRGQGARLLSRQAKIEQRGAIVVALAARAARAILRRLRRGERRRPTSLPTRLARHPGSCPATAGRRNGRSGARLCRPRPALALSRGPPSLTRSTIRRDRERANRGRTRRRPRII